MCGLCHGSGQRVTRLFCLKTCAVRDLGAGDGGSALAQPWTPSGSGRAPREWALASRSNRWIGRGSLVIVLLAGLSTAPATHGAPAGSPFVVWAWQRPEDLAFARPPRVGVACLVATARITGRRLDVQGRRQPLRMHAGTVLVPVVRIEVSEPTVPEDLESLREALVAVLRAAAHGAPEIQIDFDTRRSERPFYGRLLRDLRTALPARTRVSITALASWCLGEPWIEGLPVDEAVPMLFRMGPEGAAVRAHFARGGDVALDVCRGSYGLSTDELGIRLRPGRRIYLFHPRRWTESAFERARRRLAEDP